MLVDGGNFNGQIITGIGLDKAFQFYWRANYLYQVPTTGYADHADSLMQFCQDLIGFNVPDLRSGLSSGQMITSSDCEELAKVVAAVEMYVTTPCTRTTMPSYRYQYRLNR